MNKQLIPLEVFEKKKKFISDQYNQEASKRDSWIKKNKYYYDYLTKNLRFIVEPGSRVLQIKCETGYFLNAVNPKYGLGVDSSKKMIDIAKDKYPSLNFEVGSLEEFIPREKFDYILLIHALGDIIDIQKSLQNLKHAMTPRTRLVVMSYSRLWQPIISLSEYVKFKIKQPIQNWLSMQDTENLLYLSGYEIVKHSKLVLVPVNIFFISRFFNEVVSRFPFIENFCLNYLIVAKVIVHQANYKDHSISVIIPCKNEKGNIEGAVRRIPVMGRHTEIIFCDDKSNDGTAEEVLLMKQRYPDKDIKLFNGPGICKAKNIWVGFEKAQGDILMILDADLTVIPEELPLFFNAMVEGRGEFINGSRLVYPMNENSMKFFNVIGNKFFSLLFSYILDQKVKDTLCGTKVMWRKDYFRIKKFIGKWGTEDLWGDYDLLFGAAKINLKIIDLPIHYFDRVYGKTKMTKVIKNGVRMLKISIAALFKLKIVLK